VFERAKAGNALDRAATVTGSYYTYCPKNVSVYMAGLVKWIMSHWNRYWDLNAYTSFWKEPKSPVCLQMFHPVS
jgi:hypothetical protein